jgi:hypothetical protein
MTMTKRTEKLPGPRRSLSGWPSITTPMTPARVPKMVKSLPDTQCQ